MDPSLERIQQKLNSLEKQVLKLQQIVNLLKITDTKVETEFKYMKILLALSIAANSYIGYKLNLPQN